MRGLIIAAVVGSQLVWPGATVGAEKKKDDPAHVKKDVADHLAMAEAHLNAAKCLKSGTAEKVCHAQLAKDCKGLGIGKICGMKHQH